MTWQVGILTDREGNLHLGAVVAVDDEHSTQYVDLLSAVGACRAQELDLERLVMLKGRGDLAALRGLAGRCIDDPRLRNRLVELTYKAAATQRPQRPAA